MPLMLMAKVEVVGLKTENMVNPLGISTLEPRFSWKIESDKKELMQTSYHILVASSKENLDSNIGDLWDTGTINNDEQLWITYKGKSLKDNQRVWWKVRITTNRGKSEWSNAAHFSVGLTSEGHWSGRWIGIEDLQDGEQRGMHTRVSARYLRKDFKLNSKVRNATAYVAGLGLYEFYVNGQRMGENHVLQPVPSDYRKSIYYNTYDVTHVMQNITDGKVCLAIILGNGRYFPMRQEKPYKTPIFGMPKCRVNVIVEYEDGRTERLYTDEKWKLNVSGPIRANNEYDGEEYNASMEMTGWNLPGFDDSSWMQAQRCGLPDGTLRPQMTEGMVAIPYGNPKSLVRKSNSVILDFGQNMSGWITAKMRGNAGDTILIRYAEKLDSMGNLYIANLRNAKSTDIYVCNGKERGREWHPTFVYHGFRYVEVVGMPKAEQTDFQAILVADDMKRTGDFVSSDTILNKVWHNALYGIISNYKGMPVDCPQRNERQPWLGDRTVGCLGESFMLNNERLYSKWMHDLAEGQRSDGAMSNVTPSFWNYFDDNMTWPAVFPFATDMLYTQFGNKRIITDSYPYIKKWYEHMITEYEKDGIITKDKYADWCLPPEKLTMIHSADPSRITDGQLISTAYGVKVAQVMEKFARIQGLSADESYYHSKAKELTDAFNRKFLTVKRGTSLRPGHVLYPDSVFYGNNTATSDLLPLAFGMVPDSIKNDVVKNLVTDIISRGNGHVTCGVIGISWLQRVLSDNGFADIAWLLATTKSYPSWGYMAQNGATTIWELWNGDKANPSMNSGNHVMLLGDLLTWCYQYIGGIRQTDDSQAYKHIVLKPSFDIQDCFSANVGYETPYGEVRSSWKKTLQSLSWDITVPANTTAKVCFPDGKSRVVGSGKWHFDYDIPTDNKAIIQDEFLYDHTSFPSAHASTIVELKNGDLVAAYFGGTFERNPDVCIWTNRRPKGSSSWEVPVLAGDGVFRLGTHDASIAGVAPVDDKTTPAAKGPIKDIPAYRYNFLTKKADAGSPVISDDLKRKSCWNPVLFEMPDGELWLFYKVGVNVADWQGCVVKSKDGGRTWGPREMLPHGFIGPVKNKPFLSGDRLICGSSTEGNGWRFHVEIYNLKTKEWKYVGPITSTEAIKTDDGKMHPIDCIQPSILKLKDGSLKVLMRTHNGFLAQSYSTDNGDTWSDVTLSSVPNNQSGTDAVTLKDGRHVLIYNNFETIVGTKKGPRTPLSIAVSDDGETFRHILTLEDSPINQYSYPAIIEGRDGKLHCVYTWRRERISYKEIDLRKLGL